MIEIHGTVTTDDCDTFNNLTTVTQGSQTRSFTYNSLSRLLSAANPESGTISYGYDPNGNLTSKTDARSITTSYAYDALNRVTSRSYNDSPQTPTVTYTYDDKTNAKGKLIKVSSAVSTTEYTSFDILGRVTGHKQTTDGGASAGYTTGYTYKLGGALDEETYPSTRVVKNVLDANGDLSIVESRKNTNAGYWHFADSFTYNAAGAVTSMQLGNGRWESTVFNSRLQPTQIALGTVQGGTDKLKLDFTYNATGNGDDNGNILTQTITVPTIGSNTGFAAVQTFTYDSLNRIHDAVENVTPTGGSSSQSWKQEFSYDRYGNRSFVTGSGHTDTLGSCTTMCNPTFDSSNNRITSTGFSFDLSGNTTRDAGDRKFTYDGENKQTKVESLSAGTNTVTGTLGEYSYDGDGKRVKKYVPSTGEVTVFVYDAGGKSIAEYSIVVASVEDAKVNYLTNDHLGSPRINTDRDGNVTARHDYHPFGEEIVTPQRTSGLAYAADTIRKQFTGYERDGETMLDFAQARFNNSVLGRFTSPDPLMLEKKRVVDPQGINLYVYSRNNPLSYVDRNGRQYNGVDGERAVYKKEDGKIQLVSGKPTADLEKLVRMINDSGSKTAMKQFIRLNDNQTKITIRFESERKKTEGGGLHNPQAGKRLVDTSNSSDVKNVEFTSDGKEYAAATITLFEGNAKDNSVLRPFQSHFGTELTSDDLLVGAFAHEAEHDLDPKQIQAIRSGVANNTLNTEDNIFHARNPDGSAATESPRWYGTETYREILEYRRSKEKVSR